MTDVKVYVPIDGQDVHAGTLYSQQPKGVETASFAYTAEYIASKGAYELDPALVLRTGTTGAGVGRSMFGAFTDCAPDRWGRRLVQRQEAAAAGAEGRPARKLGEIDYLLGVRDDLRQGALRFRVGDGPLLAEDSSGVPVLTQLPTLLELAARAQKDTADLADLRQLIRAGSSLGGARPKVHVRDSNGRTAIAKFPSDNQDTWNVMAWEKVALDLAAAAGIDVPASSLLEIAGRSVLVVERFDRTVDEHRIGYASAMTMLGRKDGDVGSYLDIAARIEETSRRATAELEQLWRRIAFSVLISNTDDHLRNHGFLHERGGVWQLSPAFDLNPNPEPGPKYLATNISDTDNSARITLALEVAGLFRLDAEQARSILRQVALAVSTWPQVASRHTLSKSEQQAMAPAFAALAEAIET